MAETQTSRLDRIEQKIDKLSDAMISLARAEEKLISIEHSNIDLKVQINDMRESFENKFDKMQTRIEVLEKKTEDNYKTICVIRRIFWLFVGAVIIGFSTMQFEANSTELKISNHIHEEF